jgi:hypothetical protein
MVDGQAVVTILDRPIGPPPPGRRRHRRLRRRAYAA